MELNLVEHGPDALRAGYDCPCGCTPALEFARGGDVVTEGCCCGNEFAVGPQAAATLTPRAGFESRRQTFETHWGDQIEAAWLVGPSVHPPGAGHDHHAEHDHSGHEHRVNGHDHGAVSPDHGADHHHAMIDPVCGMTVEPEEARARGLHTTHAGTDYFFCGKGCLLEFGDDPARFLDPSYRPSM